MLKSTRKQSKISFTAGRKSCVSNRDFRGMLVEEAWRKSGDVKTDTPYRMVAGRRNSLSFTRVERKVLEELEE